MIIQRFTMNREGRDIAVGDIHGHFSRLYDALDKIHFNSQVDRLFGAGDLIDRGPENMSVVGWLEKPWFHTVKGNHDDYICRHDNDLKGKWKDTVGKWFMDLSKRERSFMADHFRKLPLLIEVETPNGLVGIVHAECPFPSWNRLKQELLEPENYKQFKLVANCCMFSRRRFEFKEDDIIEDIHAVVVGHQPVEEVLKLGNVHYIDTMGWKPQTGHFTLYDLHTLQPIT